MTGGPWPPNGVPPNMPPPGHFQPGGHPVPPAQPPHPVPVDLDTSRLLWRCAIALGLVGLACEFLASALDRDRQIRDLLDRFRKADSGMQVTQTQVEAYFWAGMALAAVIGIAVSALVWFAAERMRVGRPWARVTLIIVGGFQVSLSVLTLLGGGIGGTGLSMAAGAVGIVRSVLAAGAIYLMQRPESLQYFAAVRTRR